MRLSSVARRLSLVAVLAAVGSLDGGASIAGAATAGWTVRAVAEPSAFSPSDTLECGGSCARYQILVSNLGDAVSTAPVILNAQLPAGIAVSLVESGEGAEGQLWECNEVSGGLSCALNESVPNGGYTPFLDIQVKPPSTSVAGPLAADFTAEGGGSVPASAHLETPVIESGALPFAVTQFHLEPMTSSGLVDTQAGGHPWQLTSTFSVVTGFSPYSPEISGKSDFVPVKNIKTAIVNLPLGMIGNAQATEQCTSTEIAANKCPPRSRVGEFAVIGGFFERGEFLHTGQFCCSAVYNMVPEHGYPAQFAFKFAGPVVTLHASVAHGANGYYVQAAATGIPVELELATASLTFFGDPSAANGNPSGTALLTNPSVCSHEGLSSRLTIQPWEAPQSPISADTVAYLALTGCENLRFEPTFSFAPSSSGSGESGTTQADAPSAYLADLKIPQSTKYDELATPPLRDATVKLPVGVSVSPSAAQGLVACQPTGPEGINVGSEDIGAEGRDLGDPEATELGAGHAGGNGSPYDDGLYHTAPGHCPQASMLGTVEVFTPLLPEGPGGTAPLTGRVYLAQPRCGGSGQPECTEASATNGELYGLDVEVAGSGVIVKLAGKVEASPATGQLTANFEDNPQFPFSHLRFNFRGGARAPLANPQMCGSFATASSLSSWAGQDVSKASEPFAVDWDGKGAACPASLPFSPGFSAGTVTPIAGAFSPFTLTFSRQDREQDLSGLSVTLSPGLLGKIAGIPLCEEAQANAGACSGESQIGTTSVLAGPGEHPLYVPGGRVYLTSGYKGQPFGLSIVVPAVAGPFNLGNVVVRAAIHIDRGTSQVTVLSDPFPQSKDGVPFRLRTVNVEINRSGGFTFNPTNCSQQQITGTIAAAQGATANVSSPFAVTGCASLPFKPSFSASTQGQTSKAKGASLTVKVTQKPGEANIHKVSLQLPLALPTRLTTLQKACTEAQFNANPAGCPEASNIGTATAVSPVLNVPLTGPALLVSHGAAAFPDVEFVLQGQGVQIVLDGKTDIKKGITYSRFETIPDAPISSFETSLPEGPHSALTANANLCALSKTVTVTKRVSRRVHGRLVHVFKKVKQTVAQPLLAPTTITGQNGAQVNQSTRITITGCPKAKNAKKAKKAKRASKASHHNGRKRK
jgi:hypothetical protein